MLGAHELGQRGLKVNVHIWNKAARSEPTEQPVSAITNGSIEAAGSARPNAVLLDSLAANLLETRNERALRLESACAP